MLHQKMGLLFLTFTYLIAKLKIAGITFKYILRREEMKEKKQGHTDPLRHDRRRIGAVPAGCCCQLFLLFAVLAEDELVCEVLEAVCADARGMAE